MFEDYKESIRDFYLLKKEYHKLSINLEDPGREKLRNEAVSVFRRKHSQEDIALLKSIFDPENQSTDLVRSMERFNLDKFRAVVSFLVDGSSIRDERLVKLTAWLLDFPPYAVWRGLSDEEKEKIFDDVRIELLPLPDPPVPDPPIIKDPITEGPIIEPPKPQPSSAKFYILIGLVVLLFVNGISFIIWINHRFAIRLPNPNEKCMYWKGDHFEPVSCEAKGIASPVIALNLKTLKRQRKILLPDTLTSRSLGKVWYSNIGKKHEFFTYSGIHPIDTVRQLRPVTGYILNKYVSYHRFLLYVVLCAIVLLSVSIPFLLQIKKIRNN